MLHICTVPDLCMHQIPGNADCFSSVLFKRYKLYTKYKFLFIEPVTVHD